jgi:hypothetical protein
MCFIIGLFLLWRYKWGFLIWFTYCRIVRLSRAGHNEFAGRTGPGQILANGFADGFVGSIGVLRAKGGGLELAGGKIEPFGGPQFLRREHGLQQPFALRISSRQPIVTEADSSLRSE